jgi:16S rRNA (cytidine1402-2'-O)-methyltransferase
LLTPEAPISCISPEIVSSIEKCDIILAENNKTVRRYFKKIGIQKSIDSFEWVEINKHQSTNDFRTLLKRVQKNSQSIGIISESGCPAIADPGSEIVKIAHQFSIKVKPLSGPNSMILALMASGFSGQSFAFNGYLPIESSQRSKKLKELEMLMIKSGQTQLFMETPFRNNSLFEECLKSLNDNTKLCVVCNLTLEDELILSKPVKIWKLETKPDFNKKPSIFLIGY